MHCLQAPKWALGMGRMCRLTFTLQGVSCMHAVEYGARGLLHACIGVCFMHASGCVVCTMCFCMQAGMLWYGARTPTAQHPHSSACGMPYLGSSSLNNQLWGAKQEIQVPCHCHCPMPSSCFWCCMVPDLSQHVTLHGMYPLPLMAAPLCHAPVSVCSAT